MRRSTVHTKSSRAMPDHPTPADYERDLYAWALENARLLRKGRLSEIDAANIAEELEDMGRSERRSLKSHLRVLLLHFLKWQFQPMLQSPSWRHSIRNARDQIDEILEESPSLERQLTGLLETEYRKARRHAVEETGLAEAAFPATCPYPAQDVRDPDFLPGEEG